MSVTRIRLYQPLSLLALLCGCGSTHSPQGRSDAGDGRNADASATPRDASAPPRDASGNSHDSGPPPAGDASQPTQDAGLGMPDASVAPPALWPLVNSGSRLQARVLTGNGLEPYVIGWHDSALNIKCELALDTDGVTRCLPTQRTFAAPDTYLDRSCKRPIVSSKLDKYTRLVVSSTSCDTRHEMYKAYGPTLNLSRVYDSNCSSVGFGGRGWPYREVVRVRNDAFVSFALTDVPIDDVLALRVALASDGARVVLGPVLRNFSHGRCEPLRDEQGTLRCVPTELTKADGSSPVIPLYDNAGCSESRLAYACDVATQLVATDLPELSSEVRGAGPLAQRFIVYKGVTLGFHAVTDDGETPIRYGGYVDTSTQTDCFGVKLNEDDSFRCVPSTTQEGMSDSESPVSECPATKNTVRLAALDCPAITHMLEYGDFATPDVWIVRLDGPPRTESYINRYGDCSDPVSGSFYTKVLLPPTTFPQLTEQLLAP